MMAPEINDSSGIRMRPTLAPALALAVLLPGSFARAQTDYVLHCSGCHGLDGAGHVEAGVPSLAHVAEIAREDGGRLYLTNVPGVRILAREPARLAAVLNHLMVKSAKAEEPPEPFDAAEVKTLLEAGVVDVVSLRRRIAAGAARRGAEIGRYPWP